MDSPNVRTGSSAATQRDVEHLQDEADVALHAYAKALREWNAPDDQHTRYQLQLMLDRIIKQVFA